MKQFPPTDCYRSIETSILAVLPPSTRRCNCRSLYLFPRLLVDVMKKELGTLHIVFGTVTCTD